MTIDQIDLAAEQELHLLVRRPGLDGQRGNRRPRALQRRPGPAGGLLLLLLEELLPQISEYELAAEPQHIVSSVFSGFESLIVTVPDAGRGLAAAVD